MAADICQMPQTTGSLRRREFVSDNTFIFSQLTELANGMDDRRIRFSSVERILGLPERGVHYMTIELNSESLLPGFGKKIITIRFQEVEYEKPIKGEIGFVAKHSKRGSNPLDHLFEPDLMFFKDSEGFIGIGDEEEIIDLQIVPDLFAWDHIFERGELYLQVVKWADGHIGTYYPFNFGLSGSGSTGPDGGWENFFESLENPRPPLLEIIQNEWNAITRHGANGDS